MTKISSDIMDLRACFLSNCDIIITLTKGSVHSFLKLRKLKIALDNNIYKKKR